MKEFTRKKIIEAAKEAEATNGAPISSRDFARITGISPYHIYRLFPDGGWREVRKLAGLERHPGDTSAIADDQLMREFNRVASELGKIPTWTQFAAHATISADVIRRRLGGLQGTLKHYRAWLEENEPNSPLLEHLKSRSRHEIPAPPQQIPASISSNSSSAQWTKLNGPTFGAPINFRGLRHAPINEQGVVFLFGMVSYELGFIVEAVHAAYPDCEAKRCVDQKQQRWQHIRIEFEHSSSNFRVHGHDPANCDVIVCWEHDWADCPLEVIELRRVIDELEG
ncbi:MAG TPA: hypothetical protein PLV42_02310 [bacterium]|nr:hypothetical protein [bacterium]